MTTRILVGDALETLRTLESESVQMIGPTSPPYLGLRSYLPNDHPDKAKEIGSEPTPDEFVAAIVAGFREARRVLRPDGIFVLNLGDSMSGSGKGPTGHNGIGNQGQRQGFTDRHTDGGLPAKNLLMIPFRVAIALQADGWILRSVIPWLKRSGMPESAQDRPTISVEYLFLFSRRGRYYWDPEAIKMPGADPSRQRNERIGGRNGHTVRHGEQGLMGATATRAYRNSDAFFQSWQGLMLDDAGDPLALIVNPQPNTERVESVHRALVALDAVDDDTKCIPSPDCPLHGSQDRQGSILLDDGYEERSGDQPRSLDNGICHASEQIGAPVATVQSGEQDSLEQSQGSLRPPHSDVATLHSNGSRRTAPDPETKSACTPFDRTGDHIDGMSVSPSSSLPDGSMVESNSEQDGSAVRSRGETITRTAGTPSVSCTCSYYKDVTKSISHFASFPPKLVEPFVKAGTSEKGACSACGAGWVRVVEKPDRLAVRRPDEHRGGIGAASRLIGSQYQKWLDQNPPTTTGWRPGCACDAGPHAACPSCGHAGSDHRSQLGCIEPLLAPDGETWLGCPCNLEVVPLPPRPCVVLDPFLGSGTTALVADRLGRDAIGIELNAEYAEMSRNKIASDAGSLFGEPVTVEAGPQQLGLLEQLG